MRFNVALAQREPIYDADPLEAFSRDVKVTVSRYPEVDLVVYPELHLHGTEHLPADQRVDAERKKAVSLDSDQVLALGQIAKHHQIWLCPGSIGEIDGEKFYNTQLLFNPKGELVSDYRKMFPWRPFEPHEYGTEFVVSETDFGRVGLSNCYDAWFPEHSRHLGWLGAQYVLNIVKTITPDREQELVLAKANAIVNQKCVLAVSCAAPVGRGRAIAVVPEGYVLGELGDAEDTLIVAVDTERVTRVRRVGTRGTNRLWHQLDGAQECIDLPMYQGKLSPENFHPNPEGN